MREEEKRVSVVCRTPSKLLQGGGAISQVSVTSVCHVRCRLRSDHAIHQHGDHWDPKYQN